HDETTAVQVLVRGRVQGVGFRFTVAQAADRAGVRGWVTNREDGSVGAHLEGPSAAVEQVLDVVRSGPASARVDAAEVQAASPQGLTRFEVR
ncbi:acylphosphatase, partial [Solicola sp. PLA-1-18]|uniref:acylphosphatase n=1 Tax=Solicola sp. PLA-1-18 TaxID=3380532 RepID=UPI003B7A9677